MPQHKIKAAEMPSLLRTPGKHSDGAGLYLQVSAPGRASWTYRFSFDGKVHWRSIGPAKTYTLAEAREAHHELRRQRDRGVDPREVTTARTFGEAVEEFIAERAQGWRGGSDGREAEQYRRTLAGLAGTPIATITTDRVRDALKPWADHPRTAEKVRTRIAKILDWATAPKMREGNNSARRKGHMEHLLPDPPDVVHHPAMPWRDVPAFMQELHAIKSSAARALMFTILTAARTSETTGATWKEIEGDTWVIPGSRMKEGREHRVPLTAEALALIGERKAPDAYLFPGRRGKLSDTTQMQLLRRTRPGFVVHGFRSTFADWCGEAEYPRELIEMALAHAVGDATERANQRSALVNRRREMMEAWSAFATGV